MKTIIATFFFLPLAFFVSAQSSKFNFGLEVSPNFTNIARNSYYATFVYPDYGFRPAMNIDFKAGYIMSEHFVLTGGVGYLTTRELVIFDTDGQSEIYRIESEHFHSYVFIPVGVKYYMGTFFISPEISIGWNTANVTENTFRYPNGVQSSKGDDLNNLYQVNAVTYPVFFSFGNEIRLKSCTIALGVKAYLSLNPVGYDDSNYGHYYGFGVLGGITF